MGLVAANWLQLNLCCQVEILQSKIISKSRINQHEHKTEHVYLYFQHFGPTGQTGWRPSQSSQELNNQWLLQYAGSTATLVTVYQPNVWKIR